jgi:hypothetical protein
LAGLPPLPLPFTFFASMSLLLSTILFQICGGIFCPGASVG